MNLAHKKRLLGNRHQRDENNASNEIVYILPYQTGALSSPLAAMIFGNELDTRTFGAWAKKGDLENYVAQLEETHKEVKLSDAEKLAITNWLDVNAPFHPSYWGRKHEKFKGQFDYRPALTLDEARSKTKPVKLQNNTTAAK